MAYRRGSSEPNEPETFPRGTRDISRKAWEAQRQPKATQQIPLRDNVVTADLSLHHRVELTLRTGCLSTQQVAKSIREPVGKVAEVIRAMREDQMLYNVGTQDHPRWCYRVGDHASALELRTLIRRLLLERRMTTPELARATGARPVRISRAIAIIRNENDDDDESSRGSK